MNLDLSLIISILTVVASVAFSYGIVKAKIERIDDLEKKVSSLEKYDEAMRKLLFHPDGMTIYTPMVYCNKQHEKQDRVFDTLTKKVDEVISILMENSKNQ